MALQITTVVRGTVAEITLSGELGKPEAPQFEQELRRLAAGKPSHLVLRVRELSYLGSPGIRVLLLIKQQLMPKEMPVYVIAPRPGVLHTLDQAGTLNSFTIQDEDPAVAAV